MRLQQGFQCKNYGSLRTLLLNMFFEKKQTHKKECNQCYALSSRGKRRRPHARNRKTRRTAKRPATPSNKPQKTRDIEARQKSDSSTGRAHKNIVPLCKECTNSRCHEDSSLFATLARDEATGPVHLVATTHLCGQLWHKRSSAQRAGLSVLESNSIRKSNHRARLPRTT